MTVLVCIATIWLIGVVWFGREVIHSLALAKASRSEQALPPMAKPSDERPNLRAGPGGTPSSRLFAVEHAATQDELAAAE
jgi:hypothetical protein